MSAMEMTNLNQWTYPNTRDQKKHETHEDSAWLRVCALTDLVPGSGVAAWVGGQQVALVRACDGLRVYALSNFDPFSRAFVMARGIVGDRAGVPKISSPIFKQSFSLESGECLDDPAVRLRVYPVRLQAGDVYVHADDEVT